MWSICIQTFCAWRHRLSSDECSPNMDKILTASKLAPHEHGIQIVFDVRDRQQWQRRYHCQPLSHSLRSRVWQKADEFCNDAKPKLLQLESVAVLFMLKFRLNMERPETFTQFHRNTFRNYVELRMQCTAFRLILLVLGSENRTSKNDERNSRPSESPYKIHIQARDIFTRDP